MPKNRVWMVLWMLVFYSTGFAQQNIFRLNDQEYFENRGVNVMAFQDFYPEGHQGGVAIIMLFSFISAASFFSDFPLSSSFIDSISSSIAYLDEDIFAL